jgi:integrase
MSVTDRRKASLTGRGESPSQQSMLDVEPPEQHVDGGAGAGRIEARSERAAFDVGSIDYNQLALALAEAQERLKPVEAEKPMLGALAHEWHNSIKALRVSPIHEQILIGHLTPLYLEDEASLTVGAVRELMEALLAAGYSPSTVNKVRGAGKHTVDYALATKQWSGPNPFTLARRVREPERDYVCLSLLELAAVIAHLPPERVGLFRVCLLTGMRPGEVLALQKEDVDFEEGTIHVHRSHERDETKTGTDRLIPIPPGCAGDLLEASLASPSELLFPDENGELQRRDTKLTRILRTAMAKAGVGIVSVTYKCRRRGCEAKPETHESNKVEKLDCMRCGMRLWPVPEVKPIRWYDLRHMCATFHHAAKTDEVCVAKALGHSITGMTRSVYTHPTMEQMRRELTKWRLP